MARDVIDYDKKFLEDLERAQAISLESLALERFKHEKILKESKTSRSTTVSRTSSMNETDNKSDKLHVKSRPRPGCMAATPPLSIIAPPPASQRRNSSSSMPSEPSTPDLISFTSPPPNTAKVGLELLTSLHTTPNISHLTISQQSPFQYVSPRTASPMATMVQSPFLQRQQQQYYWQTGLLQSTRPPEVQMKNINLNFHNMSVNSSPTLSSISFPVANASPNSVNSTQRSPIPQTPPALPPKNQQQKPPPITLSSSIAKKSTNVNSNLSNLIDLAPTATDDKNSVRVSILEAFDPLLTEAEYGSSKTPDSSVDESASMSESVYDEFDPYDFIHSGSGNNSVADSVYATVVRSESVSSPSLPPRNKLTTLDRRKAKKDSLSEKKYLLYDNIRSIDIRRATRDADVIAFYKMVLNVRSRYRYNDIDTNMGLVISPMGQYRYREGTSIKLCVYPHFEGADKNKPISFTCDVTTGVNHVTMQSKFQLDAPASDQYTLKVCGYDEYLAPSFLLSDYKYIHDCIKLDEDVKLMLIPDRKLNKSLARTIQDDNRNIKLENILPNEPVLPISHDHLRILLETLENEIEKLEKAASDVDSIDSPKSLPSLQPLGVVQSVKCVVKLMGNLETLDITDGLDELKETCNQFLPNLMESWCDKTISGIIKTNCEKIRNSIQGLIEMYCQAFRVDFELINRENYCDSRIAVTEIQDSLIIKINAIHRPSPDWKYDSYIIAAQVFHGTQPVRHCAVTQPITLSNGQTPRIVINSWLDMEDVSVSTLPRESRLVLIVYGRTLQPPESGDKEETPQYKQEEIGWSAVQFFNYEGIMASGNMLLSIWPKESGHRYGPAPCPGTHPDPNHPVFSIIVACLPNVYFPPVVLKNDMPVGEFCSLDLQTQQILRDVVDKDMLTKIPSSDREILWEKRHYLYMIPAALPEVLLAAHRWEWQCLEDIHGMLEKWKPLKPIEAIQLLLPVYPDMKVRKLAVSWIETLDDDELVDFLPQLVVALRHETYEDSPLAAFLLKKSLQSLRVAHHLFWLLSHNLPGITPQIMYESSEWEQLSVSEVRHHRRILLLLRALLAISSEALCNSFMSQQLLNKSLKDIAENVQKAKEAQRLKVLRNELKAVDESLERNPTCLPLSPTLRVSGIQTDSCNYFPSNTLPLKIHFLANDGSILPAIYKVGDDLQQDMLVLQMVRLMDKLWLKEGLDLKMVSFDCVPTGKKRGIIELVTNAETLRKIHVEHGLTGSFKDKPIAEWLAKHNSTELEYSRAVENFTASCAGYCVVTYILGICDRHNDNIMLKKSGHLFHIDFGKFLGDAQMFGNFKRDRAPFVLTSDMAYVINGGDRPSEKFHKFVDLCCQAFNIVRNNGNLFLYLFTLMASSGIRGVTTEAVNNLNEAILPGQSNPEAAAYFARLIQSSLKSWFTQINFFLHNLAQFKLTGESTEGGMLSFVPTRYTMQSEGRLSHVQVVGYRKRYDPDKYYVYILRVWRQNQNQAMEVLRTYKEFCELHQKLCVNFPLAKLYSLSTGLHMGRSNIKQVAAKRYQDISLFISSLFKTAEEICHSDLIYTFFHPLLRDQTMEQFTKKAKERRLEEERTGIGRLKGQLKLSIHFQRDVFRVMVYHVRGLPLIGNGQEPSTYVKVYLQPDPSKTTKRKTKVVKRNCHPSFMETLEYRMSLDIIMERTLKATVWNYDPLQENEFLGGVELVLRDFDLTTEMTEWYPLINLSR